MKKVLCIIGIILAITSAIIGSLIYHFFYSMNSIPKGEYMTEAISPNGDYTVKAYLCNAHATVAFCVRGELVNNSNNKTKNIYWDYRIEKADIQWEDDDTVIINGHKIEVPEGKYDWRRVEN